MFPIQNSYVAFIAHHRIFTSNWRETGKVLFFEFMHRSVPHVYKDEQMKCLPVQNIFQMYLRSSPDDKKIKTNTHSLSFLSKFKIWEIHFKRSICSFVFKQIFTREIHRVYWNRCFGIWSECHRCFIDTPIGIWHMYKIVSNGSSRVIIHQTTTYNHWNERKGCFHQIWIFLIL